MQSKTTMRYYLTPTKMTTVKKIITSVGENMKKLEHSHIARRDVK